MYNSFVSLDKCYSLGNFHVSEIGRLIKITSIEKQLFTDETCKIYLEGFRLSKISNVRNLYKTWQIIILWVKSIPKMQKF